MDIKDQIIEYIRKDTGDFDMKYLHMFLEDYTRAMMVEAMEKGHCFEDVDRLYYLNSRKIFNKELSFDEYFIISELLDKDATDVYEIDSLSDFSCEQLKQLHISINF